ncbi:hypothetical protein [Lentzea sp. NBRC 105346]|uniref:hypothetical protein n=1 Tax=Lentzea sp. NBRC 105346 TaxID=3032205 RepID=UPI0025551F25|nr:hypothetical protein [Lentzea sp. NBRC 105346]
MSGMLEVRSPRWQSAGASLVVPVESYAGAGIAEIRSLTDVMGSAAHAVGAGARRIRVFPVGADAVDLIRASVFVRRIAEEYAVDVEFSVTTRAALLTRQESFLRTSPLVVEADGTVVPLCAGISRRYALGSLADSPLSDLVAAWDPEPVLELCRAAWRRAVEQPGPLISWHDHLLQASTEAEIAC